MGAARTPSWCQRLEADLDAADKRAITLATGLSSAQLNWKPRANAWSVGQCLEHLCLTNEVYIEPIAHSLRGEPTGPVEDITPGFFGRWFIRRYIEPTTQRRPARAPRKSVPVASHVDASILDRFLASNVRVRDVIARAWKHDVNRVRFRNPFVPLIRFTVGTGLQIIARHNHRHLQQAERVKNTAGFPRA